MKKHLLRSSRKTRNILVALTLFVAVATAAPARALDYLPIRKIVPGMKGYGLTVFKGSAITKFPVQVLGVVPGEGPGGDELILVRVSGKDIQASGGIALGMSGSPVYIDGKLIGAISSAFPNADHMIGGVTPAELFLKAGAKPPKTGRRELKEPIRIAGKTYDAIETCTVHCGARAVGEGTLLERPAMPPIAISGVSERAFKILRQQFEARGMEVLPRNLIPTGTAARAADVGGKKPLQPGSAVAIQLVRGPVDISAIGTVTALDGDRLYAFGHPFFHKGTVEFLMADAQVYATVPGDEMPFKIAAPGNLRGTFIEDRGSTVIGKVGVYPKLVPLDVTVEDKDTGRIKTIPMRIVRDRELMAGIVITVLLESMDRTVDRIGRGTSRVEFTIDTTGYDGGSVSRKNMFFSDTDISAQTLAEILQAMDIITHNEISDTSVNGIRFKAVVDSTNSVAAIEKAEIATGDVDDSATGAAETPDAQPDAEDSGRGTNGLAGDAPAVNAAPEAGQLAAGDEGAPVEPKGKRKLKLKFERPPLPQETVEPPPPEVVEPTPTDKTPTVYRGEKVKLRVTVHPFRSEPVEESLFLRVPDDIAEGAAVINVFSGTRSLQFAEPSEMVININVESPESTKEKPPKEEEENKIKSIDDILGDFANRDRNNELVASISPMGFNLKPPAKSNDTSDEDDPAPSQAKKRTRWVLNGSTTIHVRVADRATMKEGKIRRSRINALGDQANEER